MKMNKAVTAVTAITGTAITVGLFKFNQIAVSYNHYILGNLIGLIFIPMLMIFFVLREDPSSFGFARCGSKRVWVLVGLSYAVLVAGMVVASRWVAFQNAYPYFRRFPEFWGAFAKYPAENPFFNAPMLMLYAELSYGLYMFCWEFYFRGYLLFGLGKSMGWWAVLLQAIAFGVLHSGKPTIEMALSFGAGIFLGIIALNAKSFVPCFALHWAASITFDILVVASRK